MKSLLITPLVILALLASLHASADVDKEKRAAVVEVYSLEEPFRLKKMKELAEQDNYFAAEILGESYFLGTGLGLFIHDFEEAAKWYRLGAEQGYATAQLKLGDFYRWGLKRWGEEIIAPDGGEAFKWYSLAAEQGSIGAQVGLGQMYEEANFVGQNFKEAMRWYRLAADKGSTSGQIAIGRLYVTGKGVAQDQEEGMKWFKLAANRGSAEAQFRIGLEYNGPLHLRDAEEAMKWYLLAAEQGHPQAQ